MSSTQRWAARVALAGLAATVVVAAPPLTHGRATAAPATSEVLDLDAFVPDPADVRSSQADGRGAAEDEWQVTEVIPAPTAVMVGVEIEGAAQPAIEARILEDDGWSEWVPLPFPEEEDGPDVGTAEDRGSRNATEPLWVGEAEQVQVRMAAGETGLDDARLHTVNIDGDLDYDPTETRPGAANASTSVDIIPRSSWDPNNECRPSSSPSYASTARYAVIHHTASTNNYTSSQATSQLRGICLYHRDAQGWSDIGYNFVVDRYGRIYEGRAGGIDRAVIGAHARNYNSGSIGVTVMGCFDTACSSSLGSSTLPSAALSAVDRLVAWKFGLHGIDPYGKAYANGGWIPTIVGHRDVGNSSCPGNRFSPYVRGSDPMNARVAKILKSSAATPTVSPWSSGNAGRFAGGKMDGLAAFSPDTGDMLVARSDGGSFDATPWTRFKTKTGWAAHLVGDVTKDGRTDTISFHQPTGNWWVGRAGNSSFTPELWATFKTTTGWKEHLVGDFTGDGRTDVASFHRNGTWWVSASDGGKFTTTQWGEYRTADGWQAHLVGDFTGNGRDEIMSYHPGSGRFYLLRSRGRLLSRYADHFDYELWGGFGTADGWGPHLVGDTTGDGRADVISFHQATGRWWVNRSTGKRLISELWATFKTTSGWQTHLMGDTTGDGRADLISYHPGTGNWWVNTSTGSEYVSSRWMQFGTTTGWNRHVVLDADGDGRADVASFHGGLDGWWVSRAAEGSFATSRW